MFRRVLETAKGWLRWFLGKSVGGDRVEAEDSDWEVRRFCVGLDGARTKVAAATTCTGLAPGAHSCGHCGVHLRRFTPEVWGSRCSDHRGWLHHVNCGERITINHTKPSPEELLSDNGKSLEICNAPDSGNHKIVGPGFNRCRHDKALPRSVKLCHLRSANPRRSHPATYDRREHNL